MHHRNKSSHHTPTATDIELRNAAKMGDHLCAQIDVWRKEQGLPAYSNSHLKTNAKLVVNPHLKGSGSQDRIDRVIGRALEDIDPNQRQMIADAVAKTLKSSARGDDDDARQIIADLISDDRSPFTPDDEEALRFMSAKALKEMRGQYLKANTLTNDARHYLSSHSTPVANRSGDPAAGKAMSTHGLAGADFARDMEERRQRSIAYCNANPRQRQSVVVNSDDPAAQAMSAHSGGLVAHFQKKEGK